MLIAPELGFEYDVLIYDDIECKIEKWEEGQPLEAQERLPLTEAEKDAVESYIENAEPPIGVSLNQQYCQRLNDVARNNTIQQCERYGFDDMIEVLLPAKRRFCTST